MELSHDRRGSRPHARGELRRSRQQGDRQHAFGQAVGRRGPADLQPDRSELGEVRIEGWG